jgi:dihydrofolate synthase/folylpolyglutamate synthase
MTVGLAFEYFKKQKVDIAIIEVGMGGRLDSTNIITPLISIITNIGLDHTQFLGTTLPEIAFEKAGIIKPKIPVVIGEYVDSTKNVFIKKALETKSEIYFASDLINEIYSSVLLGDYQVHNKKTVLQAIKVLQVQNEFIISEKNVKDGFLNVIKNTNLQGRWQQIHENPKVICDTAHNKEGLKIVLNQVLKEDFKTLHIVLGFVNDKNLEDIFPLFPKNAKYFFCKPNIPRGLEVQIVSEKAKKFGLIGNSYSSISEAYQDALKNVHHNDFIYIGGSTFVVAEVL